MKILYVASDQRIDAPTGGSVHVREVAEGLTDLGHEIHVLAIDPSGDVEPKRRFTVHPSRMWLEHRALRWSARSQVRELIGSLGIDLVIERYYNFGGEGVRAAFAAGIPSVLEVNSPVIDHPHSLKATLDALFLVRPMRRYRRTLCQQATAIVSPLTTILPPDVAGSKVHRVHWGANVDRFHPDVDPIRRPGLDFSAERRVVVFSGSFRAWHGADVVVRIAAELARRGSSERVAFLLIGDGPSFRQTERLVRELDVAEQVVLTGGVAYDDMPGYLALADIGIAPYQPSRHGQMRLGFYWSPLKVFEYMAMGLPVITLRNDTLAEIVRPDREGLLVDDERDLDGWARAVEGLAAEPARARTMGAAARARVGSQFSWREHCKQLDAIFRDLRR